MYSVARERFFRTRLFICSWVRIPSRQRENDSCRDGSRLRVNWRREWDSNPRTPVKMLLEFQSSAFDRSAISPFNKLRRSARVISRACEAPRRGDAGRESYTLRLGEAPALEH